MPSKEKADLHRIGSKENHSTGKSKRFLAFHSSRFPHLVQCRFCGSGHMRFAVNGYCQRCQRRVEYVLREDPATAGRANPRGTHR